MFEGDFENENIIDENEQNYRDRAEERRKGILLNQVKGGCVQLEGFEKEVKLNGLDFNMIQQDNKQQDKLSLIAKIKNDLSKAKENIPKKTINPMAIKIEAFLQKKEQLFIKNTMAYFYKYDIDPNYGNSLPQFYTKKKELEQEETTTVILDKVSIEMINDSLTQTNYFQKKRYEERHKFDQNVIIPIDSEDDDESEDIFNDAKEIEKPKVDVKKILEVEVENQDFDLKDYLQHSMFDQKQYNQFKQQVEKEEKEKAEKLKKHKQMLEGGDDYYYECYQPLGLTIVEEKEHKEEVEAKKQVNPEYKDMDFIKQDFKKKKKKRQNLQNQLDQIEDILQKKKK